MVKKENQGEKMEKTLQKRGDRLAQVTQRLELEILKSHHDTVLGNLLQLVLVEQRIAPGDFLTSSPTSFIPQLCEMAQSKKELIERCKMEAATKNSRGAHKDEKVWF